MNDDDGESLSLENTPQHVDVEQESIGEGEVRRPFDPTQIRVETKTQTIDNLIERMRHKEILLRPISSELKFGKTALVVASSKAFSFASLSRPFTSMLPMRISGM